MRIWGAAAAALKDDEVTQVISIKAPYYYKKEFALTKVESVEWAELH
jgi:hypothetical protein